MTERLRRFATPILGLGAGLLIFGVFWTLIHGELQLVGEIAGGLGIVAIAGYVALEPARVWSALTGRMARQGGNATVITLAVIGILILANFISARHSARLDVTAERQFSLSKQSLQVLAGLTEPVTITAFMTPNYYAQEQVRDLLKEYTLHCDKLSVEYIDPEQKLALARQYGISQDGTLIFQSGDRRQESLGYDEQAFTSALVKVTRTETKMVYFLTGHGERDPEGSDAAGYRQAAEALKHDNYDVKTLNLTASNAVPDDAATVIIAAPTAAPTAPEVTALNAYVDRGGSLLLLGDPSSDVALGDILSRWGLSLRQDIAVDPASSFFGDVATPLVSHYPYHTITKDLTGMTSIFPLARSIAQAAEMPAGVSVSPLVRTSSQSWGETDLENRQVQKDADKDTAGPLDLAVAATLELPAPADGGEAANARLVVLGDSDLVSNDVLQSVQGGLGNADLFLNAVSWLAEEESLISIRAAEPTLRTVLLTPTQVRLVMYTSILFLPGLVVAAGVWVWWRRR
ncbi:MAG TPA: Gldg family protein [Anaerolineae bacterium]|nr:Gldg family protein [Anaerolineae bacterium]